MRLRDALLKGAGATGALFDIPGSMVRDVLGGENPFDQLMTPFSLENRLTGRDLLRQYGLAGQDDTGLSSAGGVVAEMALDPLMWAGGGALTRVLRGARPAAAASRAPVAASLASPVAGAYLVGDADEGEDWKRWLGQAMIGGPMVYGMAKGLGRLAQSPGVDARIKTQTDKVGDLRQQHSTQVMRRQMPGRARERERAMRRSEGTEQKLVEGLQELEQLQSNRNPLRAEELRETVGQLQDQLDVQTLRGERGRWRDRERAFRRRAEVATELQEALRELGSLEGGMGVPSAMIGAAGTGALTRALYGGEE